MKSKKNCLGDLILMLTALGFSGGLLVANAALAQDPTLPAGPRSPASVKKELTDAQAALTECGVALAPLTQGRGKPDPYALKILEYVPASVAFAKNYGKDKEPKLFVHLFSAGQGSAGVAVPQPDVTFRMPSQFMRTYTTTENFGSEDQPNLGELQHNFNADYYLKVGSRVVKEDRVITKESNFGHQYIEYEGGDPSKDLEHGKDRQIKALYLNEVSTQATQPLLEYIRDFIPRGIKRIGEDAVWGKAAQAEYDRYQGERDRIDKSLKSAETRFTSASEGRYRFNFSYDDNSVTLTYDRAEIGPDGAPYSKMENQTIFADADWNVTVPSMIGKDAAAALKEIFDLHQRDSEVEKLESAKMRKDEEQSKVWPIDSVRAFRACKEKLEKFPAFQQLTGLFDDAIKSDLFKGIEKSEVDRIAKIVEKDNPKPKSQVPPKKDTGAEADKRKPATSAEADPVKPPESAL